MSTPAAGADIWRWDGENIAMDSVLKQVQKREKGDNQIEAEKR